MGRRANYYRDYYANNSEKRREYLREYYNQHKEAYRARQREYNKRLRADRKAKGLCILCGKQPPRSGRVYCLACAIRRAELREQKKEGKG